MSEGAGVDRLEGAPYVEREFPFDCYIGTDPEQIAAVCSVLGRPAGAKVVELRIRRRRVVFVCHAVARHASGGTYRVRVADVGASLSAATLEGLWMEIAEELGAVVRRAQAIAGMG